MHLSHTFKKYLSNTSWLFAEKIFRMIVGFSVGVWVTRYLGPERLGIFSYAQSFVFLFSAFATLGLDGIVVRELVKNPEKRDVLLGTSFVLKLVGAFITLGFLGVAIYFSDTERTTAIIMMLFGSATVFQAFNVIDFYFQSKVLSKYVVFAQAGAMVVANGIKIMLIINEAPLVWFAGAFVFEVFLISGGLAGYFSKSGGKFKVWVFKLVIAKELLINSWPLILSGVMISLYMKVDQIMITQILGSEANGHYSAAARLSELWYFIPIIISSSLFPAIIEAKKGNLILYNNRLQRLFSLVLLLSLCILVPITYFSSSIIEYLYGSEFEASSFILSIHIWTLPFVSLGVASGKWLLSENLIKHSLYRSVVGICTNITLNSILIPKLGISGAATASLIAQINSTYLFDSLNKYTRPIFYLKTKALFLGILK